MGCILGIDFGTTNSVMAVARNGQPVIIPNRAGERETPSIIAISAENQIITGTPAKQQAALNPQNTLYSVKRLAGRKFIDPVVQNDLKFLPYQARQTQGGDIELLLGDQWYSPQAILAHLLVGLRWDAQAFLKEPVKQVVITVPAYYTEPQRKAICEAGERARLKVLRIINEPTAACLAYGFQKGIEQKILVYHLGGGTLDVSVVDMGKEVFEVVSTSGDNHLGGDDFDQRIMYWIMDQCKKKEHADIREDRQALGRVRQAAEQAKIQLSSTLQTQIHLPNIARKRDRPVHLNLTLTRGELNQLVADLVTKSLEPCEQALKDAKLTPADIDQVILVGQQTRMPAIVQAVEAYFGRRACQGVDPVEAVALGAAIQGGVLGGGFKDILLLDVTPFTLSVESSGGVATPLIERNTTIPTRKRQIFSTASNNQKQVEICILQGERPMAADNLVLARLILEGIPPAPKGIPQIEVTFDINADGILKATAQDKATHRKVKNHHWPSRRDAAGLKRAPRRKLPGCSSAATGSRPHSRRQG